ncbi:RDD family protein [Branchiibius cervicis]|uniref:RDD family protein n=1 Tax=Branchiibius cervicis TaxID=908252 RepID=A0ABW2AVY2_9MICO
MSNDSGGPSDPYGQPGPPGEGQQPPQYNPPPPAPQGPPSYSAPQQPPAYQQPGQAYPPAPGYGYGGQQPGGYPVPGYAGPGPDAYSSWTTRAGGFIIDFLIGAVPAWIIELIGASIGGGFGRFIVFIGYIVGLVILAWNRWFKGGNTGQSVGRGVVGVKVISEQTGQPIGALMAFVRDIAHLVDSLICYIGWLFPLWDAKRQTLGDKIMSTVAVPAPKVSAQETIKNWDK